MPKMKTHSAASKRFRRTGSGKIRRYSAFGSHILTKKTSKRKRSFKQGKLIHKTQEKMIKEMLPYS